jgi:hypothetical protein
VQDLAKHLVLDLHQVISVEELAGLEPGSPHPFWVGVQAAERFEALGFGGAFGHEDRLAAKDVILYTPLHNECKEPKAAIDAELCLLIKHFAATCFAVSAST